MLKIYPPTIKFKPCWILANPRSGSTYLLTLLNLTGFFDKRIFIQGDYGVGGSFEEYGMDEYFDEYYLTQPPPYNKIHYEQWYKYFKNAHIERYLPNIKYVRVRRHNFLDMAISWHFAKITQRWNLHRKKDLKWFQELKEDKLPYDFHDICKWYKHSKILYTIWDTYLQDREFLSFESEDIVENPLETLNEVLQYIGYTGPFKKIDLQHEKMSLKLDHPLKEKYKERFIKELKNEKGHHCLVPFWLK
jgi:LPS sulfotransferase NodH